MERVRWAPLWLVVFTLCSYVSRVSPFYCFSRSALHVARSDGVGTVCTGTAASAYYVLQCSRLSVEAVHVRHSNTNYTIGRQQ